MGEHLKIIEYPKRRVESSLTKRNKTLFINTSLITSPIKLRRSSLNNSKIYIPKRFFTQTLLLANIFKFTDSPTSTDLSFNPLFVTGFTDGDGSFSIGYLKI